MHSLKQFLSAENLIICRAKVLLIIYFLPDLNDRHINSTKQKKPALTGLADVAAVATNKIANLIFNFLLRRQKLPNGQSEMDLRQNPKCVRRFLDLVRDRS